MEYLIITSEVAMAQFDTFHFGELGPLERFCLLSFVEHGHSIRFHTYEREICPTYCQFMDAEKILPKSSVFYYQSGFGKGSISAFSNLFRYQLLNVHGGWWIDTDVVCLADTWPVNNIIAGWEREDIVNCAVLRLPSSSPILSEAVETCTRLGDSVVWGQTGPKLITKLIKKHGMLHKVRPQLDFYPITPSEFLLFVDPDSKNLVHSRTESSFCVHLWSERFRSAGIQRSVMPPHGSYLHELVTRFNSQFLFAHADDRAWGQQINSLKSRFQC